MPTFHPPVRQRGFSMIEALVAMVVLSIGLLGLAALYTTGFKTGRTGLLRSKGVVFVADMADRIRTNPDGGASYVAGEADLGEDKGCADYFDGTDVEDAAPCDAGQMASHDIFLWKQMLTNAQSGLPEATGTIERDDTTTPPTYTVTVNWVEGEETFFYTVSFQN